MELFHPQHAMELVKGLNSARMEYLHQIGNRDTERIGVYTEFFNKIAETMKDEFTKLRDRMDEIKDKEEQLCDGKPVDHIPLFDTEFNDDPVSYSIRHKESITRLMMLGHHELLKSIKDKGFGVRPVIVATPE